MTLKKENKGTQRKKGEILKILKIFESEKIMDKKTLNTVKREMLSAYYSCFLNNSKLNPENECDNTLKKINNQIIDIDKKINEVKKELMYNKVKRMSRISINNNSKKRLKNIVRNSAKMMTYSRGFLSDIIDQPINKVFDRIINRKSKIELEKRDLQKKYKNLNQKKNQLLEEKDILTKTNKNYLIINSKKAEKDKTLKEYMDNISDGKMKKILNYIDSLDIRENELQKEKIKNIILDSYKNAKNERQNNDLYKMAKSLKSFLNENFEIIMRQLDGINEKIIALTLRKSNIIEKIKSGNIDEIIKLKEEEYGIQLEIIKLKKEYNEIKYDIEEKLKAYDGSTYEEKRAEFLNGNLKNGK